MTQRVWVLGDAVVDLIPETSDSYLRCPGGAPANVAVGVARLGGNSSFIGRVGNDSFGRFMRQVLQTQGVETQYMHVDATHHTSTVVVDLDSGGERSFTFMVNPSADLFLQPEDLPPFAAGEWLHVCSIALAREPSRSTTFTAMQKMADAGGKVSFDPNIRTEVWDDENALRPCLERALMMAHIAKLSQEELTFITGVNDNQTAIAEMMRRFPLDVLLVTLGAEGVLMQDRTRLQHFTARKVTPVDTTGAGDAFVAGLLAGLAASPATTEQRWAEIIAQAQACGALATTAKGAMTALPDANQLRAFLFNM